MKLLLIAEAPPPVVNRYFYFPDVATQDSLFRYVVRGVLGIEPTRTNKPSLLAKLRDAGAFLIDLCADPVAGKADLPPCVSDLVHRAIALNPEHVILVKVAVYDAAYKPLKDAGLPVVNECIPFPGSGHQTEFADLFERALLGIGWGRPAKVD